MKLTEVNLKNKINFFNEGTWSIIDQVSINFYSIQPRILEAKVGA